MRARIRSEVVDCFELMSVEQEPVGDGPNVPERGFAANRAGLATLLCPSGFLAAIELEKVVSSAHHRPFDASLFDSSQKKSSKSSHFLDLAEYGLDDPLALGVDLAAFFGAQLPTHCLASVDSLRWLPFSDRIVAIPMSSTFGSDVDLGTEWRAGRSHIAAPVAGVRGGFLGGRTAVRLYLLEHRIKVAVVWGLVGEILCDDDLTAAVNRGLAVVSLKVGTRALHKSAVRIREVALGLRMRSAVRSNADSVPRKLARDTRGWGGVTIGPIQLLRQDPFRDSIPGWSVECATRVLRAIASHVVHVTGSLGAHRDLWYVVGRIRSLQEKGPVTAASLLKGVQGRKSIRDARELERLLDELEERGCIRLVEQAPSGGRPRKPTIELHPQLQGTAV